MKKIIWAVDAFQEMDEIQKNTVQTIRTLTAHAGGKITIEPVYVLPTEYVAPSEFYYPRELDLGKRAQKALERKSSRINLAGLAKPRVLDNPAVTTAGHAKVLIDYAIGAKADLIVVGTHARHGIPRMFLGSFAESLMLHSSVPVLTVSGRAKSPRRFAHILFPTDFEKESKAVLPMVLELARGLNARLTILHAIFTVMPAFEGAGAAMVNEYIEHERQRAHKQAKYFLTKAKAARVKVDFELVASGYAVSDAVNRFAGKNGVDLIAMAARSGKIASTLAGSITRQVVRTAAEPVWVLRPKRARAAKAEPAVQRRLAA